MHERLIEKKKQYAAVLHLMTPQEQTQNDGKKILNSQYSCTPTHLAISHSTSECQK